MPDTTEQEQVQETTEEVKEEAAQLDETDTVDYWKAQARKWEKRSKENSKATEELAEAQKRAQEAEDTIKGYKTREEQALMKRKIASEFNVPEELVVGSTEEDMRQFAEVLVKHLKPKSGVKAPHPGKFTTEAGDNSAKVELARQLFGN
jgi:hypothetical protein|nr:MAG TPA: protein of unknown function (DUF4355) [Caudoviricetes sp.]